MRHRSLSMKKTDAGFYSNVGFFLKQLLPVLV